MKLYTVRFRVGTDKRSVETTFFLDGEPDREELKRKISARGIESPRQFPASAVKILNVREGGVTWPK